MKMLDFSYLEIELWKIGESDPAPKFNVVSKPNDWGKTQKTNSSLGKAQKFQGEFWQVLSIPELQICKD